MHKPSFRVFDVEIDKFIDLKSKFISKEYIDLKCKMYDRQMLLTPSLEILSPEAYAYFSPYGLRKNLMTFYNQPNYNKIGPAHIDYINAEDKHLYSLNISIYGQGQMNWYYTNNSGKIYRHLRDPKHILYETFENVEMLGDPIDVWKEGKVALVRTDIPHLVYNDNDSERLVLSIRWENHFDWDGAVEFVQTFIDQN